MEAYNYKPYSKNSSFDETLGQETFHQLNNSLTKTCKCILNVLYEHPGLQQKELCSAINTTKSSLSNLLARIESITPPLLSVEKNGRTKLYSLTPIANAYVRQILQPNDIPKIRSFSDSHYSGDLLGKVIQSLNEFKQEAGDDWDIFLDEFLTDASNNPNAPSLLSYRFNTFINNVKQLKMYGKDAALNKLYEILNQNILKRRIEKYLEQALLDFFKLKPLLELEIRSQHTAFELVDDIFKNIARHNSASEVIPNTSFVTKEDYYNLYRIINQLITDAQAKSMSKTEAIEYWQNTFCSTNIILFYIAEKYDSSFHNRLNHF